MGAVVTHPLRCHCLAVLTERTASPAELARELELDVSDLSYHIRVLHNMNAIELVKTTAVRGAVEHFYRAVQRPELDDEAYLNLSVEERIAFGRNIAQLTFADIATSMEAGTFGERHDHHAIRFPVTVDEEGWGELRDIYADALEAVYGVTQRTAIRAAENPDAANIQARVAAFLFEMPPAKNPKTD